MKKVQIVYAVIASEKNLFFEELWASVYSFRLYEPNREIRVLCDKPTYDYITKFTEFVKLVDEIIVVEVPEEYTPKLRSRQIKTTVRNHVKGSYLFVDTDTICADLLGNIDDFVKYDIAIENECHVPLSQSVFKHHIINHIKKVFESEVTDEDRWLNSGVMYVNDTPSAFSFYECWHRYWKYSAFEKGNLQDQPALLMTYRERKNSVSELPGEYNCQVGMSVKFLSKARIFHFLHFDYPKDQSFNPFQSKEIYRKIKKEGCISAETATMIKNVKSIYSSPSCIVGWNTLNFLMSPAAPIFERIYNEGGVASWLLLRIAELLNMLSQFHKK